MGRRGIGTLLVAMLIVASLAQAADSARGRMLYEARCGGCHETSVHARAKRAATTCAAIRIQVTRWNLNQGIGWTDEEIDDVALWLNERYYRFPLEGGRCIAPLAASTSSAEV